MFIVIEGLDGAGKSTQIKLMQNYLQQKNIESKFLHFPRFDSPLYGELIARFLRGEFGDTESVDPTLVALIYAGDRHNAAEMMKGWLNEGCTVIVDRYVYSNIAYQCAKLSNIEERLKLRQWIIDMEYSYFNIPKPDLNIFLDVPFSFTEKKLNEEREGKDRDYLKGKKDIHEANIDLQRKVRLIYLEQELKDNKFKVIDCVDNNEMLPPDSIFERVKQYM